MLYVCEAWCLTLKEEGRLRIFGNRILSRIFGPKRNENKEWRKLHRILRRAGHVARIEEGRSAFKILIDKPTGK